MGVKTLDSRPTSLEGGIPTIRRRRCCPACDYRWTTWEVTGDVIDRANRSQLVNGSLMKMSEALRDMAIQHGEPVE
jgi:transcriptional regulator NrdR family protein